MEILWSLFDEKDYPQKDIVELVCEPNDSSSSKLATLLICPARLAWLSLLSSLLLLLLFFVMVYFSSLGEIFNRGHSQCNKMMMNRSGTALLSA